MACSNHLQADGGAQRVGKSPADDLARVRVGYQVQIADSPAGKVYIGYVRHPQLVGRRGDKALYQVLPLMVAMVGEGSMPGLAGRQRQAVPAQQPVETVTPGDERGTEQRAEHHPELVASNAGGLPTDGAHVLHYQPLAPQLD